MTKTKTKCPSTTKKAKRGFYRAVFKVELLSDEPIGDMSLEQIQYEMTDGHMSGVFTREVTEKVPAKKMVKLLVNQGSDPEFLGLDADGNDVEY